MRPAGKLSKVFVLSLWMACSSFVDSFTIHSSKTAPTSCTASHLVLHGTSVPTDVESDSQSKRRSYRSGKFKVDKRSKIKSMFRTAKGMEKAGKWNEATDLFKKILVADPLDSYTHLALARLEARREYGKGDGKMARQAFQEGTQRCPDSVHIWQAWARHEEVSGDIAKAKELFEKALELGATNPYVCHAYGLLEKKSGNTERAKELWGAALREKPTAALVCSLGEVLIAENKLDGARSLYEEYQHRVKRDRETTEVFLAAAWLEEQYFRNYDRAEELIRMALKETPESGRAQVALAKLEGRQNRRNDRSGKDAVRKRLAKACQDIEKGYVQGPDNGRLFNAYANIEIKARRFDQARQILQTGMNLYPEETSLFNTAGNLEERRGNHTGAQALYAMSLKVEPSASTLVALAMLELRKKNDTMASQRAKEYFERALLLDHRHGPAYNAYGNMLQKRGNFTAAREVYNRGVDADCTDPASVYHGLAKLELSRGNVDLARETLVQGLERVEAYERFMDSSRHERAVFLVHTLGMLELNSNRAVEAAKIFKDGCEKYERCSQLLLGAALCEVKLGSTEKARKLFERALRADKSHAQAWQAWGVMESRAGNYTTAKTLFEAGIKHRPRHGALWQAYASMENRMGNIENARMLFSVGVQKAPRHVPLYQGWAGLELRDENLEKAKSLIGEALTLDKTQGSSWLVAAQIEKQLGNDGLVGLILRRGIECSPSEASLYRELGEHLVSKGQINEAREVLENGLDINPLHAPLYHSLAELEARVFNVEGLSKLNKRAAQIFNTNALVPPTSSAQAWGNKLRMRQQQKVPGGIAALIEKVGHTEEDPDLFEIKDIDAVLEDEEVVKDLFQDEV